MNPLFLESAYPSPVIAKVSSNKQ